MQTFLISRDFTKTAKCLDYKRLGKQRIEAYQVYQALTGGLKKNGTPYRGWKNYPATRMWRGYEKALNLYYNSMILEWISRGYENNMLLTFGSIDPCNITYPPWMDDERVFSSHRATLLFKDFAYYSRFGWKEKPQYGYFWPV